MKKIFFIICLLAMAIIVIINLSSCSSSYRCTPSKKSRDYAVRQWVKERSDGYFVVTTIRGFSKMSQTVFECKPDSADLENLKSGKTNIENLSL